MGNFNNAEKQALCIVWGPLIGVWRHQQQVMRDMGCGNMTIIMVQFNKPIASTSTEEQSSQSDPAASESKLEES
jgi:hypothetical protein